MQRFIETTGRSEEDAISAALLQLGLERDDVSVEVVERAKSGFLGFGGNPAKVKVFYEDNQPEPPAKQPEPVKQVEKPIEKPKEVSKPKKAEKPAPAQQAPSKKSTLPEKTDQEIQAEIVEYFQELTKHMQVEATVKISVDRRGGYQVELEGQNLGVMIGRRGETLDTIQQLASYSINKASAKRVRIFLDAEGYRAKRKDALETLAKKVANEVLKNHKTVSLEPMNAYERHIIHEALQGIDGIVTRSTGVDPNRRTLICYDFK